MEEMLKQILGGINDIKEKVDVIEVRMDNMERRMDSLETRMDNMEKRMDSLEKRVDKIEAEVKEMREEVTKNTVTVEYSVNKALKIMGEGYELNAERLDRIDVEGLKNQADMAYAISKMTFEQVKKLMAG